MHRPVLLLSVLLIGLRLCGQASAEDATDAILDRFGLLGTWAVNCSQPPSASNPHLIHLRGRAFPERILKMGGSREQRFEMRDLRAVGSERLAYYDLQVGAKRGYDVILEIAGGRLRSLSSVAADGRVLIRDGRMLATGQPTLSFVRCTRDFVAGDRSAFRRHIALVGIDECKNQFLFCS
jgi:hypothetical protein